MPEIKSTLAIIIRDVFNERVFKINSKIEWIKSQEINISFFPLILTFIEL